MNFSKSACGISILASSPWILTLNCVKPSSKRKRSAFSACFSLSVVMRVPVGNLVARQANEGFAADGRLKCAESSLISAFESPAERRGVRIPSSAVGLLPGL